MLLRNKLLSLLVCSTSLLGCIHAQEDRLVQQQQDHHIARYSKDDLQKRYSDKGYHGNSKKGKKWVQYEKEDKEEDEDDNEDDYEKEEDEGDDDCEDEQKEEDFDWNPHGGKKYYRPPPIPYITFIDPRTTTTTTTPTEATTTKYTTDAAMKNNVIYSTTIDIDLGEGELIGTSTDSPWDPFDPYVIRGIGLAFDTPKPWEAPPEYPPEPICYDNTASKDQIDYLNHFTGIFGSFILEAGGSVNIQGPVATKRMQAIVGHINTLVDDEGYCRQASEIARFGLVAEQLFYEGYVNGSIAFNASELLLLYATSQDCELFSGVDSQVANKVLGMFANVFYQTSASLASYQATYKFNADNSVSSLQAVDLNQQYMIFTFPPCSDQKCDAAPTDADSLSNAILKGGSSWTGPPGDYFYEDKPTLLNIPVYVGQNYTITSEFVNAGGGILDACHTIFHFYPVNQSGNIVTDPTATFNLIRGDNVVINGLILAPQAEIYDAPPNGGFGGQVVTMQTFHSQGATIYAYSSVGTCRPGRFACWPRTNDMIVEYPYVIVNASYHEEELSITTTTADAETRTAVLSSQGIVDYTTVPTTSHSTILLTQAATRNATSTEAVPQTEIAQLIYVMNFTENAIEHTTATTTISRTRTVANQNADPTTSTLVLVATAFMESIVTRTTTVTDIIFPSQQTTTKISLAFPSQQTLKVISSGTAATVPETEHNADKCTIAEHHHYHHKHYNGYKYHKNEQGDNDGNEEDQEEEEEENEYGEDYDDEDDD